jgi:hypothetical protein
MWLAIESEALQKMCCIQVAEDILDTTSIEILIQYAKNELI